MAVTGTTLRQMVQKLDAFVPKDEMKLDDGTVAKLDAQSIAAFDAMGTVDAKIQAMRANPQLAKQFLSTVENSEGKVAIRELVTGSEKVKKLEASAAATITPEAQAQESYNRLVAGIASATTLTSAENASQANIQSAQVAGPRSAEGQAQKIVEDTLASINLSGLDADTGKKIKWGMEAAVLSGSSVPEAGIAALNEAQQKRKLFGVLPAGGGLSPEDKALVQRQIKVLEMLEKQLQAQNANPATAAAKPAAVRPKEAPMPAVTAP